jgi:hypothetical protein
MFDHSVGELTELFGQFVRQIVVRMLAPVDGIGNIFPLLDALYKFLLGKHQVRLLFLELAETYHPILRLLGCPRNYLDEE